MNLHSLRVRTAICGTVLAVTAGVVAVAPEVAAAAQGTASTYVVFVQGRFLVQRRAKHRECGRWKRGRQLRQDRRRRRPLGQRQLRHRRPDEQQGERGRPHGRIRHQHRQRPSCGCRRGSGGSDVGRQPLRSAVGHAADQRARGARGHRRRSLRRGRRHRHRPGLHHPGLAPNVDFTKSASCIGGAPNTSPAAWADNNGHGTYSGDNRRGGQRDRHRRGRPEREDRRDQGRRRGRVLLPRGRDLRVHVGRRAGHQHHQQQLLADPWLFNCKNDPEQRAIWTAERRAIKFAQSNGSLVVAAEGNQADDLSHPTVDATSPDNTTPVTGTSRTPARSSRSRCRAWSA